MRGLPALLALAAFPAPALAQHVIFEEAFELGIPASWRNIQRGYLGDLWRPGFRLVDGTGDVNHEWFCDLGFFFRDNILLSPPIDLSGVNAAWVEFGQWQIFPLSRVYNAVEVTTDGGQNFTVVYRETGTWSGFGSTKVDISAFAGQPNVQVAFHYQGSVANDWSIDNVRVTASPVAHRVTNLVQGQTATFAVSGATPGNGVLMTMAFLGAGPIPTPWGNLNLTPPIFFFPVLIADAGGNVAAPVPVPPLTMGVKVFSQAVEIGIPATFNLTNSLATTIQ